MKKPFKINPKWMKLLLMIGVIVLGSFVCSQTVWADVGNNVDYSHGSSGSSSSGSSSDYVGGLDFYTFYWLIRMVIDNPILLIVVIVLFIVFIKGKRQMGGSSGVGRAAAMLYPEEYDRTYEAMKKDHLSIQRLVEADPGFSEQMMISKVNNMFMRLQLAWMNKRWEEARPFETDALFNTHKMQLDQYIASERTNRIEDINISNTEVMNYYVQGQFEYLDIDIRARFIDYVVDDRNGRTVKGSSTTPVRMHYKWKMMRKKGVATNDEHIEATECPNCGANISINQSGRCEYCDSIVTQGDYDWVLSEIESLGQY